MEKVERGRKNEKIILAIVIVAIILISQIAIILVNAGIFNNNGEKFISLLTEKQYLCSMVKKNLDNFSGDGEKKYKFSLQNSTLTKVQKFLGISKYKLLNGSVEVEGTVVTEDKNYDVKMSLNNSVNSEIIQNGNKLAVSMPKLYKKYIVVENANMERDIKKILDITSDENSKQQISRIKKKYEKLLASSIKDDIEIEKDKNIELNGNSYSTTKYELDLDSKKLTEITKKLLKELKDDGETLDFVSKKINECNKLKSEYANMETEENITTEDIRKEIENISNNIKIDENIELKIKAYEYQKENIKTELELKQKDSEYSFILETQPTNEKQTSTLTIKKGKETLQIQYDGTLEKELYNGNVTLNKNSALWKMNITMYKTPTRSVRKIDELSRIEIANASDEEIKALREEIKNNLKVTPKDNIGKFEIKKPTTSGDEIANAELAYKRINPIMTKDEVIRILGKPNKMASGENETEEYLSWYQGEKTKLISVKVEGIKLYEVINDIAQDSKYNQEIYKSLSGDIEDLSKLVNQIQSGDTKENVIKILGDKNVEVLKSNLGYKEYIWYDKNGKSEKIKFDENDKVLK